MRQINLAGVFYPIHSDIRTRRINPWKAKLGAGSLTYSDFQNAEMEEFYDFRNGIGKQRADGSENRLWWSEGIDFSTEGQAVLGPMVNTAGSFGAAPVTIIDFESSTYAMSATTVKKWNTGTSAWDTAWSFVEIDDCDTIWTTEQGADVTPSVYTSSPKEGTGAANIALGAGATTGAVASSTISSKDLTGEVNVCFWVRRETLTMDANDFSLALYAGAVLKATINIPAVGSAGVWTRFAVTTDLSACGAITKVVLVQNVDKGAGNVLLDWITAGAPLQGSILDAIVATDTTDSYLVISTASESVYSTDGATWLPLPDCKGYLAWYDTKLRGISTDGNTLYNSATNDVDGTWTSFSLTGDFGTVYDLFEGKLLADGTPTLYMCGTQGLYTIDTTNEKAYKQEVANGGIVGIYWNANVWVATGYGILKVAPSVATYIGTDQDDGLPSGSQGTVSDFATVNNWLVFCVNGGSTDESSIFKRSSSLGGNLQVYTTSAANKAIACLHHSPSSLYTNGRLWFGEGTGIKYIMFPDTTSNVKQIATYEYVNDSGYGTLPIFRKLAAIPKTALGVAAITKSCSATDYVEVFYGLNGAAATTSLGTFKTSPKPTTLTFGSGLGTAFYTIQLAVKLYQGGVAINSPELESLMFYWLPVPSTIRSWQFRIECTDDNAAATITALEAVRDTQTLVAFYPSGDTAKTSYNVKLTQLGEQIAYEEQGDKEGWLDVQIEEVFSA